MGGVYSVEGKLGTGKSKFAVWRARTALLAGRRVASNVDLHLEHMSPRKWATYMRLPDKPTSADLEAIGRGADGGYDEDNFGVLILDELGTWLNSRSYQDKGRAGVLDWLIHARKLRWEVYLIVQDAGMIDKQVREALIEYQCKCMRMDKVRIPLIGGWINDLGQAVLGTRARRWGYLPRMHVVAARVGQGAGAIVAERWVYRGDELHACYDTEQVFSEAYPHGAHCVLPAWDWSPSLTWWQRVRSRVASGRRAAAAGARSGPAAVARRPRSRVLELIAGLPDREERIRHVRRLLRLGLL